MSKGTKFRNWLAEIDPTATPDMPEETPLPETPSLTDEAVLRAREQEMLRNKRGGRKDTFLTGPLGAPGAPGGRSPFLKGS